MVLQNRSKLSTKPPSLSLLTSSFSVLLKLTVSPISLDIDTAPASNADIMRSEVIANVVLTGVDIYG